MESIRNSKKLSSLEERALADRILQGDKRAVNLLVSANLKFVVSVCRNYRNQGLPFCDLVNEGNLGLIRAAQRFDGKKEFRFISYAVWWIRQGILTALSEQTHFLRVAPGRSTLMHRVAKARRKLEQHLGRMPVVEEVAAVMDMAVSKLSECMQVAASPVSLSVAGTEDAPSLVESLVDENGASTDAEAMATIRRKRMLDLLSGLDERKAEVLRLYYGIGSEIALPLTDIAARLNLTRERVRQIKVSALTQLRHPLRMKLAGTFV
ncbi:MAG: RNA polymerase sigma factor RpoD/SigA [Fibrobacteria bacterium]